jgi:hypothetical protein
VSEHHVTSETQDSKVEMSIIRFDLNESRYNLTNHKTKYEREVS